MWYLDGDDDGYYNGTTTTQCSRPADHKLDSELVSMDIDCDDTDALIHPATVWYQDGDDDGYSDGTTVTQCARPVDHKLSSELTSMSVDCDDTDASIHPATVWYLDGDDDGYYNGTTTTQCARPADHKLQSELFAMDIDCDDTDVTVNPSLIWYLDADGDTYYDGTTTTQCTRPIDYRPQSELGSLEQDCDDTDPNIHPATVWYLDGDDDGYYNGTTTTQCARPNSYRLISELLSSEIDCDDSDATVNPSLIWYFDGDDDGYYNGTTTMQCTRPADYKSQSELISMTQDCDDSDPDRSPATIWYQDDDADGYSEGTTLTQCLRPTNHNLSSELISTSGDCDDTDTVINPATIWYLDADADGYYNGTNVTQCSRPANHKLSTELLSLAIDCDDSDASINPSLVWYLDADADGYHNGTNRTGCTRPLLYNRSSELAALTVDCNDSDESIHPGATEICTNGRDDDCNGHIDAQDPICTTCVSYAEGDLPDCVTYQCDGNGSQYILNDSVCDDQDPCTIDFCTRSGCSFRFRSENTTCDSAVASCVDDDNDGFFDYDPETCVAGKDRCVEDEDAFGVANFSTRKPTGKIFNLTYVYLAGMNISNVSIRKDNHISLDFSHLSLFTRNSSGCIVPMHIDPIIEASSGKVEVHSEDFPLINTSANITFFNVTVDTPKLLKDGTACDMPQCEIRSYNRTSGVLRAWVQGFSTYEVVEAPPTPPAPTPSRGRSSSSSSGSGSSSYVPNAPGSYHKYWPVLTSELNVSINDTKIFIKSIYFDIVKRAYAVNLKVTYSEGVFGKGVPFVNVSITSRSPQFLGKGEVVIQIPEGFDDVQIMQYEDGVSTALPYTAMKNRFVRVNYSSLSGIYLQERPKQNLSVIDPKKEDVNSSTTHSAPEVAPIEPEAERAEVRPQRWPLWVWALIAAGVCVAILSSIILFVRRSDRNENPYAELEAYFRRMLEKGFSVEQIYAACMSRGWKKEALDRVLENLQR